MYQQASILQNSSNPALLLMTYSFMGNHLGKKQASQNQFNKAWKIVEPLMNYLGAEPAKYQLRTHNMLDNTGLIFGVSLRQLTEGNGG